MYMYNKRDNTIPYNSTHYRQPRGVIGEDLGTRVCPRQRLNFNHVKLRVNGESSVVEEVHVTMLLDPPSREHDNRRGPGE